MGINFPKTLLLVQLNMKETTTQDTSQLNAPIWKQSPMEDQEAINKAKSKGFNTIKRRRRNSLMIKKISRSRSLSARIERRIGTLRNLVPNTNDNNGNEEGSVGSLEQLFTQAADYILSLQTRVRLMKTFVGVLSNDHE